MGLLSLLLTEEIRQICSSKRFRILRWKEEKIQRESVDCSLASCDKGLGKFKAAQLVFPNNRSQSVFHTGVEALHARRTADAPPDWLRVGFVVTGVRCIQGNVQSIK